MHLYVPIGGVLEFGQPLMRGSDVIGRLIQPLKDAVSVKERQELTAVLTQVGSVGHFHFRNVFQHF